MSELITASDIAERNLKAVDLHRQGRMEEALAAASETERLALDHLPETDLERAKSICNLAAIQAAIGSDANNALRTFNRGLGAIRSAVGEQHPFYARMLSTCAAFMGTAGKPKEAELLFVRAIKILAHTSEENQGHLARAAWDLASLHEAMAKQETLDAGPPSPDLDREIGSAHFDRSAQGQGMRQELEDCPPEMRNFAEKNLKESRQLIGSKSTHGRAQRRIERRREHGEPFALFLRGFEGESYTYWIRNPKRMMSPIEPLGDYSITDTVKPSAVEPLLAQLHDKLAALAVASPASLDPGETSHGALLPRLILPNDSWLEVVRVLIRMAHLIVVDCYGLNSGLRKELEAIVQGGKCDNTVIVLHKDRSELDEFQNAAIVMADVMQGTFNEVAREWVTREHPLIEPFKRKTYVEDLSGKDLASVTEFADLIAVAPLIRSATRLGQAGTALVESGVPVKGAEFLQISLFIARGIPGWSERATVWFNLGMLAQANGQFEEALTAFAESHSAGVSMPDFLDQGRSLSMMGDVYLTMERSSEAGRVMADSLTPLAVAADKKYLARSLRGLARACEALGQREQVIAAEAELRRFEKEGSWSLEGAHKSFTEFFLTAAKNDGSN